MRGSLLYQRPFQQNPSYSTSPVIRSTVNTAALTQSLTTDYVGNIIYEINALKRILVDGGYYESGNYYFYINDHLGNNRIVTDAAAAVVQSTQYYPFGASFADASGTSTQPYKYNGKELDQMHGLNLYDYSARYYESAIGRFTTVDPLAEKYYSISPYVYCSNNPILRIDPNGLTDFTFNKKTGEVKQIGEKNNDPDRILEINKKGEIQYNKKGEAKVSVDGIEKGILKDGQNFKNKDQGISVGGEGQASVEGVKSFTLKLAEYVETEIKGYSYSSNASGNVTDMVLGKYKDNTLTSSSCIPRELQKKYGANFSFNNILQDFHTHPYGELGATQSAPNISGDVRGLQKDKPKIPNASFIILYRIARQEQPEEYDYTHEYRP